MLAPGAGQLASGSKGTSHYSTILWQTSSNLPKILEHWGLSSGHWRQKDGVAIELQMCCTVSSMPCCLR